MRNRKIIISFLLFFFVLLISNICFAGDLDYIHDYTITVDPRTDGSLTMSYYLEWEVLDSTSEGPLTWIKIGIPNANIDGISTSSKDVKSIRYFEDNGDYIRIDFRKPHYKGEILKIDFKYHQSFMYTLKNGKINYSFTPGWFNDIKVKKMTILWKASKVEDSNSLKKNSDGYLVWEASLPKGRKYEAEIIYPESAFKTDEEKQASYATKATVSSDVSSFSIGSIVTLLIIVSILSSILSVFSGGGYYSHGGYGYRRRRGSFSSFGSSCACVSSCACACACAGGGRAGCSKKDFYGTKLKTSSLNKVLNK